MAVIVSSVDDVDLPKIYPPRSAVIGWIFFDWAAQPAHTIVIIREGG